MKHLVWLILILLIIVRYFSIRPIYKNNDRLRISTTVYSEPIDYATSQYLKIAGLKTYLPKTPEINYGDHLVVEGIVNNGSLKNPKVISVRQGAPLSTLRNNIIDFYQKNLPEPEGGLLAGIILGSKNSLSQDFYNKTKLTGVAHVVVASGTNVTFVVSFVSGTLFMFLPRKRAIPFVVLSIILYLLISGFEAPLIRAAIMSLVIFLGQELGRVVSPWRVFFLSAGSMLAYNPEWITDIGFLLSFASVASIMFFQPKIKKLFDKSSTLVRRVLAEDLSVALSAQIGTTPILFVTFGQFNIWSPLINVLVLWAVAPLMVIGSIAGILGLVFPEVGKLVLYLAYPMLWWFRQIVQLFGNYKF